MDPTINNSNVITPTELSLEQKQSFEPLAPKLERLVTLTDGLKENLSTPEVANNNNLSEKKVVELKSSQNSGEEKESISSFSLRKPPVTTQEPASPQSLSNQLAPANVERAQARRQEENTTATSTGLYFGGGGISLALIVFGAIMYKFNQDEKHTYTQAIEYTSIAFIVFGCFMCCCGGASIGAAYVAQQRRRQG